MSILSAIIYGLVQGLTEFLPVSSSGHLVIAEGLFGLDSLEGNFITFDMMLHLGTLFAVFVVYYKDIFELIKGFFSLCSKLLHGKFKLSDYTEYERFVIFIIIATLPLVIGLFVKDYIELLTQYAKAVGAILIFNGILLILSDFIKSKGITAQNATPLQSLAVGLCQLCALVPGISRSGSTITGGRLMGFDREYAVKFSFILSIPAIIGANITHAPDAIKSGVPSADLGAYLIGALVAFAVGIAAMKLLMMLSKKNTFRFFGAYCILIGVVTVIFAK